MQHNSSFAPQKLNNASGCVMWERCCAGIFREYPITSKFSGQCRLGWTILLTHEALTVWLRFGCTRPWLSCSAADIGSALRREIAPATFQPIFLWLWSDRFSWPLGSEEGSAQGMLPALVSYIEHSQYISAENFSETALSSIISSSAIK